MRCAIRFRWSASAARSPPRSIGTDAFQECDALGLSRPVTKWNAQIRSADEVRGAGAQGARHRDRRGGPGPVLLDFPKDVQLAAVHCRSAETDRASAPRLEAQAPAARPRCARLRALITTARRPVFYGGGGLINSGPAACEAFTRLVRRTGAPCTLTLMGLGAFPASDPQFLGMLGMHGTLEANLAMHHADLVVCVGARFDDRVTGKLQRLLSARQKDPSRHRRGIDQQAGQGGRAAGRRLPASCWTPCSPSWRDMFASIRQRLDDVVEDDRRLARAEFAWVRTARRLHRAAAADAIAAARAGGTRRDRLDRRRPAPDVGRAAPAVRPTRPLADFGRRRHDGLRSARRDRRADRAIRTSSSSA